MMGKYYEAYSVVIAERGNDQGHTMAKEAWKVGLSLKTLYIKNASMN
jgi:hypothetical protein